jgi:hypothetical protein
LLFFREDYAHYSWYEVVNTLQPYHRYVAIRARHSLAKSDYIPTYVVRKDWLQYGRHSRSALLNLASERGDRMLLMTFAMYLPENYSREAFNKKQLDYGPAPRPIEWRGVREQVLATVSVHNEIVRDLARQHKNVLFVDQAQLIPHSGRYFNDPCHLTALGSTAFINNIVNVLAQERTMALAQ